MANNIAFQPMGNTSVIAVTGSSANTTVISNSPVNQFMISNIGTNPAFVAISTLANVTAAIPTAGTPAQGFCIPGGQIKVISAIQSSPTQTMYAAAVSNATTTIYITPGEGL